MSNRPQTFILVAVEIRVMKPFSQFLKSLEVLRYISKVKSGYFVLFFLRC